MKEESVEEVKPKKNRLTNFLIILVIILLSLFMYSKYVETRFIRVKEYLVSESSVPSNFNGVNVVYFSDLLYGTVDDKFVNNLVDKINDMKPDIVLFGGSLISKEYKPSSNDKKELVKSLSKIDSTIGKYYVNSFIDKENTKEIMKSSGFINKDNIGEFVYNDGNTPLCIYGIGSYNSGKSDVSGLVNCNGYYTIVFTHEGDVFDKVLELDFKPNIMLSGNSLGGEVNLPFYNNLIKYKGSNKYYLDYYNKSNIRIYVSNGLGTNKLGLRFNNFPSFTLIRLKSTY